MILLRRLTQVPLDNGEILLVVDGLHDEPGEGFLVLGVDRGGFEEFGVEFGDGLWVGFGTEVYAIARGLGVSYRVIWIIWETVGICLKEVWVVRTDDDCVDHFEGL